MPQTTDRLSLMFETPTWFDGVEAEEDVAFFPELSKLGIFRAAGSLGVAQKFGKIPEDVADFFEFGSGLGEGLVALDMFARTRINGARVIGSEITPSDWRVASQLSSMFLPAVESVATDGIEALYETPEGFDIVFANMFGPCGYDDSRAASFIPAALSSLKPNGVIVMNSDRVTMNTVFGWAHANLAGGQTRFVAESELPSGFIVQPHVLITK